MLGDPLLLPAVVGGIKTHDAFASAEQQALSLGAHGGDDVEVVGLVHGALHEGGVPCFARIFRHVVGQHLHASTPSAFLSLPRPCSGTTTRS
jgi:hypothetical protein